MPVSFFFCSRLRYRSRVQDGRRRALHNKKRKGKSVILLKGILRRLARARPRRKRSIHHMVRTLSPFPLLLSYPNSYSPILSSAQARKGIHPLLRCRVQYVGTNGQTYQLWSTVKHHQDRFFLSQDQYTHPAWTGIPPKIAATGQAAKFKRRGFDFLSGLKGKATKQQQQQQQQ